MSIEDIVKELEELRKQNKILEPGNPLYETCRALFEKYGIGEFDPINPEGMAIILERLELSEKPNEEEIVPIVEPEQDMGPISLNSSQLEVLLAEYDKHRDLKDAEKIAVEVQKNPLLKRVKPSDVWAALKRKMELEAEISRTSKDEKKVDIISDQRLVVETRLKESNSELKTNRLNEQEIIVLATSIVEVAEEKFDTAKKGTPEYITDTKFATSDLPTITDKQTIENIITVDSEEVLRKSQSDVVKKLDEQKIVRPEIRAEAIRIVADIAAKRIVDDQIGTATEYITQEIETAISDEKSGEKLTDEQIIQIKKAVSERLLVKILEEPLGNLDDHLVLTSDDGKVKTIETGPTLSEEIASIVGKPLNDKTIKKTEVIITTGNRMAEIIATQNSNPETGLKTDSKGNNKIITNDVGVVDLYRAVRLENEVFGRMVEAGETVEKARETARFVRRLNFPTGEMSTTISQIQADRLMKSNGYDGGDNETKIEEARIIKNLIRSPVRVSENVEKILKLNNELSGIKGFDKLNSVASLLKKEPELMQTLEFVRGVVRFQDKIAQITRIFSNPIGSILKIPAVQNFAIRTATRLGVGEMATHIAQFGLQQGIKSIASEIFLKGTVGAFVKQIGGKIITQVASKIAATAAINSTIALIGGATGPLGWVVSAGIFAWNIGKEIFGKIGGLLKKLNIDTSGTKKFLQENFGKIPGGLMDLGMKAAGLILLIPILLGGLIAGVSTLAAVIIPISFGGLLVIQGGLLNQVSSLVAPRESVTGYCIKVGESAKNPTGDINCNKNAPEPSGISVNKENFIKVAEMWRAGGGVNAALCFNDVVARAVAAGINPEYALWSWLHESGASNYGGFSTPIEDFGIHGQSGAGTNDFNAQINYFLTLDPASACISDPKIGGDYWLAFATNYLTGQCDPDFANAVGGTGRKYLEEMQATWGWISSSPMPDSIRSGSGGGGSGGTSPKLKKVTGSGGSTYVCEMIAPVPGESTVNSPLPTLDPNIQIPEGCPQGRPVSGGYISQGPQAKGCSHSGMKNDAVDFAVSAGTPIKATHNGVARVGSDSIYGNYVDIVGKCNGVTFTTRYAHMPNGGVKIGSNTKVTKGQLIGVVDNSGSSTGNHLHYDFRNISGGNIPDISDSIGGLSHSLTGCCNAENGIMCN